MWTISKFTFHVTFIMIMRSNGAFHIILQERASSPAANTRATVAIAIKYSIVERPGKIDPIMYSEISTFLMLIKDSDRVILLLESLKIFTN